MVALAALGCGEEARQADKKDPDPVPGDPQAPARPDPEAPEVAEPPDEVELGELRLAPLVPAVMTAPVTAEVEKSPTGAARISTPDGWFAVVVDDQAADLAARKAEIQADTVNRLERFVTDEPDVLVYETEAMPGQPEFHFVANVEVGDRTLSCRDETGPFWTRAQIDTMVRACRSLAPAP